jgi:hypothetical protein
MMLPLWKAGQKEGVPQSLKGYPSREVFAGSHSGILYFTLTTFIEEIVRIWRWVTVIRFHQAISRADSRERAAQMLALQQRAGGKSNEAGVTKQVTYGVTNLVDPIPKSLK